MKLYGVDFLCNHCESVFALAVASNEDEAIELAAKDHEISFYYNVHAYEINEIYGYKVAFKKGKKINLSR